MDLSDIVLAGPHQVVQSMPVRLSFQLDPDFMTSDEVTSQVKQQLPAPTPFRLPGGNPISLVLQRGKPTLNTSPKFPLPDRLGSPPVHVIKLQGHGPHLRVYVDIDQPVLRSVRGERPERRMSLALALDKKRFEESSSTAQNKKISRWAERKMAGHYVELLRPNGEPVCVIVYEKPIVAQFPEKGIAGQWIQSELESYPDEKLFDGFVSAMWFPNLLHGKIAQLDSFWRIFQVERHKRFNRAPSVQLSYEFATGLSPGDSIATWIDQDPPLALGYDADLAKAGFNAIGSDGHNCVTNYGSISIPLRCPTDAEWDQHPLPIPLDLIRGLRDTPPHSWLDEVMSYAGKRLKGMEIGPRRGNTETVPTAKLRERVHSGGDLPAQPCYDGPHLWQIRIGRYKIFAVQIDEGIVYLTDSNWRDKETAILFFATLQDAKNYCRGKRPSPPAWFGKRDHDHEGRWQSDLLTSIRSALQRRNIELAKEPCEPFAEVETTGGLPLLVNA